MKEKLRRRAAAQPILTPLCEMPNGEAECVISDNTSDGERPAKGVTHERVEIVLVPRTEGFKVRRYVTLVYEADASTAGECVTALRELCGGEITDVTRVAPYDAGHDPCTGKPDGWPGFARAFVDAGLEAPALCRRSESRKGIV